MQELDDEDDGKVECDDVDAAEHGEEDEDQDEEDDEETYWEDEEAEEDVNEYEDDEDLPYLNVKKIKKPLFHGKMLDRG